MRDEWSDITLGDIATIALSGVDKHVIPGEVSIRLCNYLDVYRNRRLTKDMGFSQGSATPGEIRRFQLEEGDIVITKDSETPDDIGIPALVAEELPNTVCGYHLAVIRPDARVEPSFLCYYLQSDPAKRHFLREATGLTRFGLGLRSIASLPLRLPPRSEQAALARILEATDAAIDCAHAGVERARELRAGLLDELLSLGLDDNGVVRDPVREPELFAVTALGRLPATWRMSTVGAEFALQTGFTLNEARRPRNRKRRYLRVANVHRDRLLLDDVQELEADDDEFRPRVLAVDDLLVVEGHADRMQIGRCARVTTEASGFTFQNHLFRLRTCGDVLPYYGCLWLNSAYAQRYWNARCATSSGLNTINQRMLRRLTIPVPSKSEQKRIIKVIAKQREHLQALAGKLQTLEQLKRSLLHDLLTGAVRVGTQQPEAVAAS